MEGFGVLLLLCLAMFLGCWLAGMVPLSFNLPESRLRLITIFGAGLLVGTALAVIIPEGVSAIYLAQHEGESESHPHSSEAAAGILDKAGGAVVKQLGVLPDKPPSKYQEGQPKGDAGAEASEETKRVKREQERILFTHEHGAHAHDHSGPHMDMHSLIGFALVIGFVFMLIVDQIGSMGSKRDLEGGVVQPRYKITATIGLVVHAAADGIALGAASTTKHSEIQLIVFVAIMLHKAPAAFGLVTFLQYEGLDKARIKKHLLVFALAAPLAALITYAGILQGGSAALSSLSTTGLLMLFSAGTFLYVATVHVLPEIAQQGGSGSGEAGGLGHSHAGGGAGFKLNELGAIVLGALLPAFLSLGHSH